MQSVEQFSEEEYFRYFYCTEPSLDSSSLYGIEQDSNSIVAIIDRQTGARLVTHHKGAFETRISIDSLYLSPNHRYIAYVVKTYFGSLVRSSTGYVYDTKLRMSRVMFPSSVNGPMMWSADSYEVLVARVSNIERPGIYVQELPHEN